MLDWSVIVVNWNTREQLRECLRSVFRTAGEASYEVFVVDNASSDGSAPVVGKEFPTVHLIRNQKNLGFAAGNNQAIKRASGAYVLLLNPDCRLSPGALENMLVFLRKNPTVGVAGGLLKGENGELQPSVRRFPDFHSQAAMLLKLHKLFPNMGPVKRYLAADHNYSWHGKADQVMGAFFAVPRHIFSEVGLLDEGFFLWFEEVDFCKRVKNAGYDVCFTPMAEAIHSGGASFNQLLSADKQKIWNRSLARYMRKHNGTLSWLVLQPLRPVSIALSYLHDFFGKIAKKRS